MEYQTNAAPARMHPLMVGAATSVILVSLLGAAAITGLIPSSRGVNGPAAGVPPDMSVATSKNSGSMPLAAVAPSRYVTPDGQVLEAVPNAQVLTPVRASVAADQAPTRALVTYAEPVRYAEPGRIAQRDQAAPAVHHRAVHHHARNSYAGPVREYDQPYYSQPAQHPVQSYVSDMHPVGTGVGAVVGGLLGHQVGGGNGKKLATVAGVLLGGYAGNEVAHNRSPLPW